MFTLVRSEGIPAHFVCCISIRDSSNMLTAVAKLSHWQFQPPPPVKAKSGDWGAGTH